MTFTALTLVSAHDGGLDQALIDRATAIVRQVVGGDGLRQAPLCPGKAVDIIVGGGGTACETALRKAFSAFGAFDVFVQPHDENRKKQLLVADMDATMVEGETLDDLAGVLGIKDKVAAITAQAMRGEIDFAEALRLRVGMLTGLPVSGIDQVVTHVKPSKGAKDLIATMKRHGAKCVLVSGGFDVFTRHVAGMLGFDKNFGNRLGVHDGRLTGEIMLPVIDSSYKKKKLEDEARLLGLDLRQTMAVGDGSNDIPMLKTAGAGVGYFGKPAVQEATPHQVRYTDLLSLLYMQGYRKNEIVTASSS